tara:strand:- start:1147 stop:1437 length:291 start_codon:yes stop_codon:yes gene_type:complete
MLECLTAADENTILCGLCASPVSHRCQKDPLSEAGCAFCNNWADIREVIAIAIESVVSAAKTSHGKFSTDSEKRASTTRNLDAGTSYLFTTDYEIR